jgi:arylsulfatase
MSDTALGPYHGFEGRIATTVAASEPWWPPRPTAPAGAPNIVIMLCDDLGFSDIGCFGSEIDTKNLDRLANESVRLTNFHVAPMCSPTRAALLTGLNHHLAGVATVAHVDTGFPNLASELTQHASTIAEIFRDNGYHTMMVGKWHLTKDSECNDAGPKHTWPCQRGFDSFYGILDPFTNFHQPHRLVRDNTAVAVDRYPDGYFFTDDLTDQAITMIKSHRAANPRRPFLLYFAHGAVHAPLQAKPADIEKYKDTYHAGWDRVREQRFRRQLDLGVIPANTILPPRNSEELNDVKAWDDLSAKEKELFARYQAVFAGMVDNIDQNFGRLRDTLETMGEWDNTIVLFTSDNGGSREGESNGTSQYFRSLVSTARGGAGQEDPDLDIDFARLDLIGGPQTLPHYPRVWGMVSSTPFRLYKINTHLGGHSVPCIFSWPARLGQPGALRTQYAHVTDVLPTLLDLVGLERPSTRNGLPVYPLAGASFAALLNDADATPHHREQYQELSGHRGYYRDGWHAVTLHMPRQRYDDSEWQLYYLPDDPAETRDLALERTDKVRELADAWQQAAHANQVFPLYDGPLLHVQRPPTEAVYTEATTIHRGTPTLERYRCAKMIHGRSFSFDAHVDYREGDNGIVLAHGDQGGGYALYVEDGQLRFVQNLYGEMIELLAGAVPVGARHFGVAVTNHGQGQCSVAISIDDVVRADARGFGGFLGMAPFEGIDIGIDRRSPVSWRLYERYGPFAYGGTLHKVDFVPGELAPDAGERFLDVLRKMALKYE